MISYKWIEKCCSEEELVDQTPYEIVKTGGLSKPGTANRSVRRNEFSAADDGLLLEYVKKHAVHGALQGNKIYEAFSLAVHSPYSSSMMLIVASSPHCSVMAKSMGQDTFKTARCRCIHGRCPRDNFIVSNETRFWLYKGTR